MYNIKEIQYNSENYLKELEIRDSLLRIPLGLSIYKDDLKVEKDDIHFGIFCDNELLGCLIVSKITKNSCKLRQMAISKDCQGKGLGKKLISNVEELFTKSLAIMKLVKSLLKLGFLT